MNRRACWMIVALLLVGVAPSAHAADPPRRPNILFILSDDQRFDTIHALGNAEISTPTEDALVERGFTFTNAYCQGGLVPAVCTPSRTMIMSGRSIFRIPPPNPKNFAGASIGGVFEKAGYATLYAGKRSNSFIAGNEAFGQCVYIDKGVVEKPGQGEDSPAAQQPKLMADAAISFLHADHGGKPLLLFLAPHYPHDPRIAPKKFMEMYDPATISLSPNFMPQHPFDNGELRVRDELLAKIPRDSDEMKRHLAEYYASITWLDEQVGSVLAAFKEAGRLDNTIVIYTSDQGLAVGGRHGLMGKQNLYEEFKSPLIIAGPGIRPGKSDALVYLFDLFPTCCDLSGVEVPAACEGASLAPVIAGKSPRVRNVLFAPYRDVQRMVRDERWKLIWYPVINRFQLFDLVEDPWEIHDLNDKPGQAAKLAEMKKKLAAEQERWSVRLAKRPE